MLVPCLMLIVMSTPIATATEMATTKPRTARSTRAVTVPRDELKRPPDRLYEGKHNDRLVNDGIDSQNGFNRFDFIQIRLDFSG